MTEPPGDPSVVAAALVGEPVRNLKPVARGGNNRVYRVETEGGNYALKIYPDAAGGKCDRLGAEWSALEFLDACGVGCVPKAVSMDPGCGAALYEWIEGEPVETRGEDGIDAAIGFAARLRDLARTDTAGEIAEAAEACLSGTGLVAQIEGRIARLSEIEDMGLAAFLDTELEPLYTEISGWSRRGYDQAGWQFADDIELAARTLSPSDFGFHNAIRRPGGEIAFIDFEYFGWDDPVRLVSDFLLHPGMELDKTAKERFAAGLMPVFGDDWGFRRRLELLYPLIGIRWCLVILNEFLPERWARRQLAGVTEDPAEACARQLDKAARHISEIHDSYRSFPFGR